MDSHTAEMMSVLLKSVYDKQLITEQTYFCAQNKLVAFLEGSEANSYSQHNVSMDTTKGANDCGYSERAKRTHDGEKYF